VTVVQENEVLHDARRVLQELLVKLIVRRRPPRSNSLNHFHLNGRELYGSGSCHESFLKTQDHRNWTNSNRTLLCSSALVCSISIPDLAIARQAGSVWFTGARKTRLLAVSRIVLWRLVRTDSVSGGARPIDDMRWRYDGIRSNGARFIRNIEPGKNSNSHTRVSLLFRRIRGSSNNWTLVKGWPIHFCAIRRSSEKTTKWRRCQGCETTCCLYETLAKSGHFVHRLHMPRSDRPYHRRCNPRSSPGLIH
jgi:hypothetical protein